MNRGFSLLECLIAMTLATGIAMSVFQLFRQNERIFRDQQVVSETQQAARLAAFQIADELRLAGQGVPVFSASFDEARSEETTVILAGSDASRINFRAGLSNADSEIISSEALQLVQGSIATVGVRDASRFLSGVGRTVYIFGPLAGDVWGWTRASLATVGGVTNSMQVAPTRTIQFSGRSRISLEEAVAIYRDASTNTIRRTAATDLSSATNPIWAPANELATNVTALSFTYYDVNDVVVTPNSLSLRNSIQRIAINLTVRASSEVQGASQPTLSVQLRPMSPNLRIH